MSPAEKPRRPWWRRALRGVGFALLGLVALLAALIGYLHTGSGQELLRARVQHVLAEKVDGTVELRRLSLRLFGDIELEGLVLRDPAGKAVVSLGKLRVVPGWNDLVHGRIVVREITLDGLDVAVVQDADGGSNLKRLFKPRPAAPPAKEQKARRIEVRKIALGAIAFSLEKADGSKLALSNVALDATVDAIPAEKTANVAVTRLAANLVRTVPNGPEIALDEFHTTLDVNLVKGAGKASLGPIAAKLTLKRPNVAPFSTDIALGGLDVDLRPGGLSAALKKLEVGLALLDSLEISGAKDGDALSGAQKAVIAGLHVSAAKLNTLLGKDLVQSDIDLSARIAGDPSALDVHTKVETRGGTLTLDGKLDASRLDQPGYDLKLTGEKLASLALVRGEKIPDVKIERLVLGLKGRGAKKEQLEADITLDLGPIHAGKIEIESVALRGRLDHGVLDIKELTIRGLGQTVKASGRYVLADKEIDVKVALDGDIGVALAALRKAGVPVKSQIPPGAVSLGKGEFELEVKGKLAEGLRVRLPDAKLRVAGGSVTLDGDVALVPGPADADGKKKLGLDRIDTDVKLDGVRLSSLAALRGKKLPGLDGRVRGSISVHGTKQAPQAKIALDIAAQRTDVSSPHGLILEVRGSGEKGRFDLDVAVDKHGSQRERVATIEAHLPLSTRGRPGLASGREMSINVDVKKRTLGELLELLPAEIQKKIKAPPATEIEAHVAIGGRTDAPDGTFEVTARTQALGALSATHQRVTLKGKISPEGKRSNITAAVRAWLDDRAEPALTVDAGAKLGGSPLLPGGAKEANWELHAVLAPQKLEALPLPPERKQGLSGAVSARIDLSGTRNDLAGKVEALLHDVHKGETGPIEAKLGLVLDDQKTDLALGAQVAGIDALRADASLALGGRGLIPKLKQKQIGDPALSGTITLPRHRLAEWGKLRPKLESFLGSAGGSIRLAGTLKEPLADGEVALDGFDTAEGRPGKASVALHATSERLGAEVKLGPKDDPNPFTIAVGGSRPELLAFLRQKTGEASANVELRVSAKNKPLGSVVPKLTRDFPKFEATGTFQADLTGAFALAATDGVKRLADASLDGSLGIERGTVPIPKSSRSYHDVELRITASREALRIERLHLGESDREKSARALDVKGTVEWDKLKPRRVDVTLAAKDFLLFGTELLGMPDAPRGALSANIEIAGDLTHPRRRIDATVHSLDLHMPDRLDKAHWPEKASLGDVIYLDESKVAVGKLEQPEKKAEPPSPPPGPPAPVADSADGAGTDIFVHIEKPLHAQKPPFEFVAKGELTVKLRPGQKPAIRGELAVLDGGMSLGGRIHRVSQTQKSRIYFDAAHPAGELDLYTALEPNPVVLQDVSLASAGGKDVRIHLTGPISKPVSAVTGVGNADLWDILPVHNAGRVKFTSQPDMPATETAQVPREYDVVLLSYMAANLPHNLFLSRMNAWADPYDDRFAYGRIQHLQADRYSKSGSTRVRATARPDTIGQSNAELEADYVMLNGPHQKAGVGLVGGSRLGGGPSVFFEWQSED